MLDMGPAILFMFLPFPLPQGTICRHRCLKYCCGGGRLPLLSLCLLLEIMYHSEPLVVLLFLVALGVSPSIEKSTYCSHTLCGLSWSLCSCQVQKPSS